MAQEDDLKALGKIADFMRNFSVVVLLLHFYWFCHTTLTRWGWTHHYADEALLYINRTLDLFNNTWTSKGVVFLFLILSLIGSRGVKSEKVSKIAIIVLLVVGLIAFWGSVVLLQLPTRNAGLLYMITTTVGFVLFLSGGARISRLMKHHTMDDVFNVENESFQQEVELKTNESSINLPTKFYYKSKWNKGWINVVNPYRATIVLGTPGSGKSFTVVNNFIKQQIEKGFSMYIYDYKFPDLSEIAYNHYRLYPDGYKGDCEKKPQFFIINFDDPARSHRCNPIAPELLEDIADAYESAYTIMLGLNRTWIQKQGDFFVESPIVLLTALIWFLKLYRGGIYCTFPHAVEILNLDYKTYLPVLMAYEELSNYLSPFVSAWEGGAQDQLQGQLGSTQIAITRMASPALYWVMTGNDFTLDINNPEDPKILVVGNNPNRQSIYSAALGLYNARIIKLINKKNVRSRVKFDDNGNGVLKRTMKSSVIIDELPTIYFRGLDNLIATARSNRVAVCLGFQDFSQLKRDYGKEEAEVIQNTVGNIFSGQVVGDTAEWMSKRFGKILQKRTSVSMSQSGTSTSLSSQLDTLIPASKISSLSQGTFVGAVADDFGQEIDQKIFNCQIVVDIDKVKSDEKKYEKIPPVLDLSKEQIDMLVKANYSNVKDEARAIIALETERLKKDERYKHLFQ